MLKTEIQIVKKGNPIYKQLDELLFLSKNMYNYANYLIRQEFIKTSKEKEQGLRSSAIWLRYNELDKILNSSKQPDYIAIPNASSQQVLRQLDGVWKSFFASIKDWKQNPSKYKGMPRPPNYKDKKNGRNELILTINQFKLKNRVIHLPNKTGLPPIKTGIDLTKVNVKIVRLVPMNNDEYIFSGKRIKRGLYRSKESILINADVNGSYNILRKEFGDAVMPTDRGLILNPISIYVDINKNVNH